MKRFLVLVMVALVFLGANSLTAKAATISTNHEVEKFKNEFETELNDEFETSKEDEDWHLSSMAINWTEIANGLYQIDLVFELDNSDDIITCSTIYDIIEDDSLTTWYSINDEKIRYTEEEIEELYDLF